MPHVSRREEGDGVLVQQPADRIDLRAEEVNIFLESLRLVNRLGDEGLEDIVIGTTASIERSHIRRPGDGTPRERGGARRARRRRSP